MLCNAQDNDSVLQCFVMHRIMIQCYSAQDNDSVLQCFVMHRIMIQCYSAQDNDSVLQCFVFRIMIQYYSALLCTG